jgi:hypothetical protein
MRTVKIERERWRTPTTGEGQRFQLINCRGCGCIMGLIGEACGVEVDDMLGDQALDQGQLAVVGVDDDTQDAAITINDNQYLNQDEREAKLKELFKDHLILEFV